LRPLALRPPDRADDLRLGGQHAVPAQAGQVVDELAGLPMDEVQPGLRRVPLGAAGRGGEFLLGLITGVPDAARRGWRS
jgi:hypothetical protein